MRKISKFLFYSLLLASCAGRAPASRQSEPAEAEAVKVRTISVVRKSIDGATNYVGRVEPSKSAYVLARVPGTVENIFTSRGRRVEKGAIIAEIGAESIKSSYEIAKATLDQAEDGYGRAQRLYSSGSLPDVKMVEIRTQLQKARAAEKAAAQALEDCRVRAPFTGIIEELYCEKGEQAGLSKPIARILDIAEIEVHFNVPEAEYASIPLGTKVLIEIPALRKKVGGTVAVKGVSASALSHSYDFTAKAISDAAGMMPGMVCKVEVTSSTEDLITVPASCILSDRDGRYVWTVGEDGRAVRTRIVTGAYSGTGVIVSEGLEEGARVVVEGAGRISTGMKVTEID